MTDLLGAMDQFPFRRDMPAQERRVLEQALAQQQEHRQKSREVRSQKAASLAATARAQLRDAVGIDHWSSLRELMRRQNLAFRDLRQPPGGLTMSYDAANDARKAVVDEFLRERRIDAVKLQAIGREFHEQLRVVLTPRDGDVRPGHYLPTNLSEWLDLSPLHAYPLPWGAQPVIDLDDPHRWFLFRPPFFFLPYVGFEPVTSDNFRANRQHFYDTNAGLVGVAATMDCDDADDFDYASVDVHCQMVMTFTPPVTGVVEVLIDAQSTLGTHDLRTEDEFGFSDSSTGQTNYLSFTVFHPNVVEPSYAEMSHFELRTDDDVIRHQENLTTGQHYFGHLFSTGPVPAGESVTVVAGTRSFDITSANDVEVHSASNFQWFLNSVEIRIAP
jgi:hypothetical protein